MYTNITEAKCKSDSNFVDAFSFVYLMEEQHSGVVGQISEQTMREAVKALPRRVLMSTLAGCTSEE